MDDELKRYRRYVAERLNKLVPIFAQASIGEYPHNLEIPNEEDEFTDLYVGVQVMLEVIRDQLAALRELNQSLEKKVADRTAALAEAQQLAHIGSWEWDVATNAVTWSDELYRIYGMTPQERSMSYDEFLERVHPDDRQLVRQVVERAYRDHRPFTFQHRITLPNGTIRTLNARGEVFLDSEGKPKKMFGTGQDITEQKMYESALLESEERYRNLVETAKDVILTFSIDGRITSLNPAFENVTGWSRQEWIGRSFSELLHPDDLALAMQRFARVMRGEVLPGHEWRVRAKSGEYLVGEMLTAPLRRNGNIVGLLGIARDVTERKRAERQIQILAQTIKSMNECVVITDLENTILFVNPAFLRTYNYEENELIGKSVTMLRAPSTPQELADRITADTLSGGWSGEVYNVRKGGEEFPIALSTSVIHDDEGKPIALVGSSRDISNERKMQRQLEEAGRQRNEDLHRFAISVQRAQEDERRRIARELHDDLGQRLSGMKLNIEMLEESIPLTDPSTLESLQAFRSQIDGMITEIRNISSNLHPAALDDFGLMVALRLLCQDFQKVQKHISVTCEMGTVKVEHFNPEVEIALYRIAQEALSNIARHSEAQTVGLQLLHDGKSVKLMIEDDGKGFDPLKLRSNGQRNRGLGLISMRERAEHLGGSVHIESTVGHGVTIQVEIPLP